MPAVIPVPQLGPGLRRGTEWFAPLKAAPPGDGTLTEAQLDLDSATLK